MHISRDIPSFQNLLSQQSIEKRIIVQAIAAAMFAASLHSNAESGNPIINDVLTADPAPMVYNDTVYLYTGHDEAKGREMFTMWDWLCFSSKDMKTWTAHGPIMRVKANAKTKGERG